MNTKKDEGINTHMGKTDDYFLTIQRLVMSNKLLSKYS